MKYSVYLNSSVRTIPSETEEIHASRPIKTKILKKLFRKCRDLKTISLSQSALDRLSGKAKKLLARRKVELKLAKVKGRPISIDLEKMLRIIELRQDYRSYGEIAQIVEVPKSTAHYLIKYASREKIRKGRHVIHLK